MTAKPKVVVTTRRFVGTAAEAEPLGPAPGLDHRPQDEDHRRQEGDRAAADRRGQRPVSPNHTDRSIFINEQALPYLKQETLTAQSTNIQLVSGATDSSYAFQQSLQAAILAAKKA